MKIGFCKPVLQLFSPGRDGARLLVFIFHRVLAKKDPLFPAEPDAAQFDWMMRFVSRNFNVLPFGQAVTRLNARELPSAAACITFDDGYQDNFSVAMPILQRYGLVGTFFIATGFLDGGRMWNDDIIESIRASQSSVVDWSEFGLDHYDLATTQGKLFCIDAALNRLKYLPHFQRESVAREIARQSGVQERSGLMMSSGEVRALRGAGMEVGAHTRSHPILSSIDDALAHLEITLGKAELEAILDEPVDVFAYPNGNPQRDLTSKHVEMVKMAGFRSAATTARGVGLTTTNPLLVPRFTPWDRTKHRFAARCALALIGKSVGKSIS